MDIDPVAVTHSRHPLAGNDRVAAMQADLRRPREVLDDPQVRAVLDLDEPLCVLLVAVLHAIPDHDRPAEALAQPRDALAPGSYLVIAHGTRDSRPAEAERLVQISRQSATPRRAATAAPTRRRARRGAVPNSPAIWSAWACVPLLGRPRTYSRMVTSGSRDCAPDRR